MVDNIMSYRRRLAGRGPIDLVAADVASTILMLNAPERGHAATRALITPSLARLLQTLDKLMVNSLWTPTNLPIPSPNDPGGVNDTLSGLHPFGAPLAAAWFLVSVLPTLHPAFNAFVERVAAPAGALMFLAEEAFINPWLANAPREPRVFFTTGAM